MGCGRGWQDGEAPRERRWPRVEAEDGLADSGGRGSRRKKTM
jgi:hypothetical protein